MRLPQRHSCVRVTSQAIHSVNSCSNNTCRQPADRNDAASSEGRCVSTNNSCSLKKIIQGLNYCEVRDVEPALAGRWCKWNLRGLLSWYYWGRSYIYLHQEWSTISIKYSSLVTSSSKQHCLQHARRQFSLRVRLTSFGVRFGLAIYATFWQCWNDLAQSKCIFRWSLTCGNGWTSRAVVSVTIFSIPLSLTLTSWDGDRNKVTSSYKRLHEVNYV